MSEEKSDSTASVNRVVLLPCPFCGGKANMECVGEPDANGDPAVFRVECENDCMWKQSSSETEAINVWHKRRANGLVSWLEAEMQRWREGLIGGPMAECKFQELKRCRKMVKRLLGQ